MPKLLDFKTYAGGGVAEAEGHEWAGPGAALSDHAV